MNQGKWRHKSDPTWDSFEYPSTDSTCVTKAGSTDSPITTTHTTTESETTSDEPLRHPKKPQPPSQAAPSQPAVQSIQSQCNNPADPTLPATNSDSMGPIVPTIAATAAPTESTPKHPIATSNDEPRPTVAAGLGGDPIVVCLLLFVQGYTQCFAILLMSSFAIERAFTHVF